jgi:hypothetical protein
MCEQILLNEIIVMPQSDGVFHPNTVYHMPEFYDRSYILFASKPDGSEMARFYTTGNKMCEPEVESSRRIGQGYMGCVKLSTLFEYYAFILDGLAIHYGSEPFDLYGILGRATFPDEQFHNDGIVVLDNEVCKIIVMQRVEKVKSFIGDSVIDVVEQFIFSANGYMYWCGILKDYSFIRSENISFSILDTSSGEEHIFQNAREEYSNTFALNNTAMKQRIKKGYVLYAAYLQKEVNPSATSLSWIQPTHDSKKCLPHSHIHDKECAKKIENILLAYNNLGLDLDVQNETTGLLNNPAMLETNISLLEEMLKNFSLFENKPLDKHKIFTFPVRDTYDRRYYIAAKIAESSASIDIKKYPYDTVFLISFDGTQIEEIDLMWHNNYKTYTDDVNAIKAYEYLKQNSYFAYLNDEITSFMETTSQKRNILDFSDSVFMNIIRSINTIRRAKYDVMYSQMLNENRVESKWVNEYKLYSIVSSYVSDAIYQHSPHWLRGQSYDVFIPSQKIAIEYQGIQHYEEVEIFGGKEGLKRTIERDKRKREVSSDNGVIVLDWKYIMPVNEKRVLSFLRENNISYHCTANVVREGEIQSPTLEMAPIRKS